MQAQCMTWLVAYLDVSWVVHGGARSQLPCSGKDAMEVRWGQGQMQASLEHNLQHQQHVRQGIDRSRSCNRYFVVCSSDALGKRSSVDLGSTIGR